MDTFSVLERISIRENYILLSKYELILQGDLNSK